ncbi:MAG TPA: hypothetical protein VJ921_02800 [Vicinamibacteria bacterium]|nr:hypothetical protein [Vicinamibacteria bacterium]
MWVYAVLAAAGGLALVGLRARRARRIEEARAIARDLIPEIRATMASCEPGGAPVASGRFALVRERIPRILSKEAAYAVEAFYRSVEAHADASREMFAAFGGDSSLSLGDKVRAKDRRDRCLKDVYYSGEGALERLSSLG